MKNGIKVFLVLILVSAAALVALPQEYKQQIPIESVRTALLEQELRYGLDLSGGAQLDFVVDMERVRERQAEGEEIDENQIIEGIKTVLQKRIDPDGTRELNIYGADFGEEKHVFVELTADIDNEETRAKLQKHIDLQFKEPSGEGSEEAKEATRKSAEEALTKAHEGQNFDVISKEINEKKDASYKAEKRSEEKFSDQIPEVVREKIWDITGVLGEVLETEGGLTVDPLTNQVRKREGYSLYKVIEKKTEERTETKRGQDFYAASEEVLGGEPNIFSLIDLPEDRQNTILTTTQPYKITEIFETEGEFVMYQLLEKNDTSPGVRVSEAKTSDRTQLEEIIERMKPIETTTTEDKLIYEEIFVETIFDPWKETGLDGRNFKIAKVDYDQNTLEPITLIEFDDEGAQKFSDLTERLVGQPMAIFVGGEFISSPIIQEKIPGGVARITQGSSQNALKEAIDLTNNLNTGAIPAPITLDGEIKVEASLGMEALETAKKAAFIGFAILILFMIFAYRLLGLFAAFSLISYVLLFFALLKIIPIFVLTLAGIAGIILSIGMAVDANVLIFERMREELANGKNYSASLSIGFERAWTSIRDSNITTLIVCSILYFFGTSIIQGFATTLAIGVLLSMFTAVVITRIMLKILIGTKLSKKTSLFAPEEK